MAVTVEPAIFVDRVSIPDLSFRPDDPASLYSRQLTHLEIQVVNLLVAGYSFRDIAARRRIRQHYVAKLMRSVYLKLGLAHKMDLLYMWECELFHIGLWELRLTPYPTKLQK
jgi:DNA-binding CsgD family transcriptional regulator